MFGLSCCVVVGLDTVDADDIELDAGEEDGVVVVVLC